MANGTVQSGNEGNNKSATPEAATNGKGKGKGKTLAEASRKNREVATLNARAISKDVGLGIMEALGQSDRDFTKAEGLAVLAKRKEREALANLTIAIVKASKADEGMDLLASLGEDKAAKNTLFDQVRLAIGVYEAKDINGVTKLDYTADAGRVFKKWTESTRSNFSHRIRLCVQAAIAINDMEATPKIDKATGVLMIEGPRVKREFGQASVALDDKQTVKKATETEKAIELTKRPSYTALGDIAKVNHGQTPTRRADSRATAQGRATPELIMTSDAAFVNLCDNIVKALNAITKGEGKLSEAQIKALEAVRNAADVVLD